MHVGTYASFEEVEIEVTFSEMNVASSDPIQISNASYGYLYAEALPMMTSLMLACILACSVDGDSTSFLTDVVHLVRESRLFHITQSGQHK
jgi:hypothetical protein